MIFNINKNRYIEDLLKEGAEEDNTAQENNTGEDTSPQDNATENDNTTNNDENNNQNNDDENMDLPEDDTDGGEDMGDDFGDEGEGEDTGSDDMGGEDESQETDSNDVIKQSEEELFANLTKNEIQMKQEELKQNFLDLYNNIDKLIERINDIKRSPNSLAVAEYSSNVIVEIKSLIYTYITKSYDIKSYTENAIMFNRCLVVLKGIDNLLGTIIDYELKDKIKENT